MWYAFNWLISLPLPAGGTPCRYSQLSLGLDIGSSFVKLVALSRRPDQWALKYVALSSLPEGSIVDGEVMDSGAVADPIEALFTQLGLTERRVISAISGRTVTVKPIRIPTTNPDELRRSLPPTLNEAKLIRTVTQAAGSAGIENPVDSFNVKAEPRTEHNLTIRTYEVAYLTGTTSSQNSWPI